MPRTSSSSRPSVKSFPVHTPPKAVPLPAPKPYVPPQSSVQTIQMQAPGVWDSVKQGFGWGIGTSIARGIFTPTTPTTSPAPLTPHQPQQAANKCQDLENSFNICVKGAPYDIQTCQPQLDSWNACLKNA